MNFFSLQPSSTVTLGVPMNTNETTMKFWAKVTHLILLVNWEFNDVQRGFQGKKKNPVWNASRWNTDENPMNLHVQPSSTVYRVSQKSGTLNYFDI